MIRDINFLSAFRAEFRKLILLKIPHRILFLNLVFLGLLIGMGIKFSGLSGETPYTLDDHKSIMGILLFYSRFILLFIVSASICTSFGSEFEWKTIHQFIIKGLSSEIMILSKLVVYYLHFLGQFILYSVLVVLGYYLFSPGSFSETTLSVPWWEILSIPLGILFMVSLSIFCVGFNFSSSKSLILNFLYYVFIELILRGFLFLFYSILKLPYLENAGDYTPYKSFLMVNPENPDLWIFLPLPILYSAIFVGYTIVSLRKKEYALVNV